jgi:hypothetical protein
MLFFKFSSRFHGFHLFSQNMDATRFPELIKSIYAAVDELETMFPGRHFTPDGHMVGSVGEALAAHYYGINLLAASTQCHDGECGGLMVQVKATQGDRIALSSVPDHLLVLKVNRDGTFSEQYNGPGQLAWNLISHKKRPKNGQYQLALSNLRRLMSDVPNTTKLPRLYSADEPE